MFLKSLFILCACVITLPGYAAVNMNLTKPYDIFFKPELPKNSRGVFSVLAETGTHKARGFDTNGCLTDVLRLWTRDQNGIAMLEGFPEQSPIGQLLDRIQGVEVGPIDDGVRGHYCVSGDLKLRYNFGFAYRHCLPLDFSIGVYLPVYSLELQDVVWQNLTRNVTDADVRVRENLTNNFFANVFELGDGLQLGGWRRSGVGDLTVLVEWLRDFPQQKPLVKNVRLNARLGPSFPTGKAQDEDLIFARAFGNDGAMGVIFGGGLVVSWGDYAKLGLDVQLLHLFGNIRNRRIKMNPDQTDFLLLQKACAYRDWAMTQEFNIFMEFGKFYRGWCLAADYQFYKHGADNISVVGEQFSSEIANSEICTFCPGLLEEWTAHNVIVKLGYDFSYNLDECAYLTPTVSLYAKVPFNGRNSALFTTVGVIVAARF